MCGIWGAVSSFLSKPEKEFVFNLATINTLRGVDSSGIAIYEGERNKYNIAKSLYVAPEMLMSQVPTTKTGRSPYNLFLGNEEKVRAIIGHCRAATIGAVTQETAHPFLVGDVIGVHNGTIRDLVPTTLTDKEKKTKVASDSYNAYVYLSTHTPTETYAYLDDTKNGAFALVWFDIKKNTINFMRNEQRPLHYLDAYGSIYFSSLREDLEFMMKKANKTGTIKSFDVGHHYSLKMDGISKMTSEKVKEEKVYSSFIPYWRAQREDLTTTSVPTTPEDVTKAVVHVLNPSHHCFGPQRMVPIKKLKELTKDGDCCNCTDKVDFTKQVNWFLFHTSQNTENHSNETFLVNDTTAVCDSCLNDPTTSYWTDFAEVITSEPFSIN
jgi:asparagine synthetase B (glutamine-hydrolysing)